LETIFGLDGDAMYALYFCDEDGRQLVGCGFTPAAAARDAWRCNLRTDCGPLATCPATLEQLADAVADAYGGEAGVDLRCVGWMVQTTCVAAARLEFGKMRAWLPALPARLVWSGCYRAARRGAV
jgi:hypothetical protein